MVEKDIPIVFDKFAKGNKVDFFLGGEKRRGIIVSGPHKNLFRKKYYRIHYTYTVIRRTAFGPYESKNGEIRNIKVDNIL